MVRDIGRLIPIALALLAGTAPVRAQDSAAPKPVGIASQYPGNEGIEKDPRVLFADDFETGDKDLAGRVYDVWFDDVVVATEYIGPVRGAPANGKKVGHPGRTATSAAGASLVPTGKRVFSEKFENGVGGFKGGELVDGALSVPLKGAEVWRAWSVTVRESTSVRFKMKPEARGRPARRHDPDLVGQAPGQLPPADPAAAERRVE